MSVNVKLGNNTVNGVDVVKLENADSVGDYIEFSPYASPPETPTDSIIFYSLKPLTLRTYNGAKNWNGTLQYSTDNSSWSTWDGTTILTAAQSDGWYKLYLRGSSNTYLTMGASQTYARWVFAGSRITCAGNLNKLLNYSGSTTLGDYAFAYLFYQCGNVDFNVTLPATTLAYSCYSNMFNGCASLTSAPELPATTLDSDCYASMFLDCISLTTAPKLPAIILATGCYSHMFWGCTSLTSAPELPGLVVANYCYEYMFQGCISLASVPELPATILANYCYQYMFLECSNIKMSTSQAGEYQTSYRIPTSGTGRTATGALNNMFANTGGSFKGTPSINTTYYTSNTVIS